MDKIFSIEFNNTNKNDLVKNFSIRVSRNIYYNINKKGKEIVNDNNHKKIIIKNFFSNAMKVNDVYRYNIKIRNNFASLESLNGKSDQFSKSIFNDQIAPTLKWEKSIVIILESPHKKEYNNNEPIAPAQSSTGLFIKRDLVSIIINKYLFEHNHKFEQSEYKLIIAEPIAFQASLYNLHNNGLKDLYSDLRDQIWETIFAQDDVKKDFIERISNYNPELIINACTKNLKPSIINTINNNFANIKSIKTNHPSSWLWRNYNFIY